MSNFRAVVLFLDYFFGFKKTEENLSQVVRSATETTQQQQPGFQLLHEIRFSFLVNSCWQVKARAQCCSAVNNLWKESFSVADCFLCFSWIARMKQAGNVQTHQADFWVRLCQRKENLDGNPKISFVCEHYTSAKRGDAGLFRWKFNLPPLIFQKKLIHTTRHFACCVCLV